jgi:hypothetical protein
VGPAGARRLGLARRSSGNLTVPQRLRVTRPAAPAATRLRFPATTRRALSRLRRPLVAQLTLTASDRAGNRRTVSRRVVLLP